MKDRGLRMESLRQKSPGCKLALRALGGGLFSLFLLAGCANNSSFSNFEHVSAEIEKNIGTVIPQESDQEKVQMPPGISLEDGLSEREAVAIALWNNSQFQADLGQLGISRAEVLQAGQIKNPNFYVLFPVGIKQLEARLFWAFSEFQARPHRLAIAVLKARRAADSLIQNSLTLARDTQVAFADLFQNHKTLPLAQRRVRLMTKISEIEQARFRLGDSSELDSQRTKVDALVALEQLNALHHDGALFTHRLISLLGLDAEQKIQVIPEVSISPVEKDAAALLEVAFAASPELRMAKLEVQAAGEQIGLEKSKIFNLVAILDGKQMDSQLGPGISMDLPIFNQNEGGIALARAQLDMAGKQYVAVREKIRLSVQEAHTRYLSALERFDLVTKQILPQQEQRLNISTQAFEKGDISYLTNLDMERQWVDTQLRQTAVLGDLMRRTAELGLSIGRPIDLWSALS